MTRLHERLSGETPEARISAYLQAIQRDDRDAALALWPSGSTGNEQGQALTERRAEVTDFLLGLTVTGYRIGELEWWSTCCDPSVTTHAERAVGARIRVEIESLEGRPRPYIFDIFTVDPQAVGSSPRRWQLRDIYRPDQEPLYWRYLYEPTVRYLPWPP